jgi:hypothetical protein
MKIGPISETLPALHISKAMVNDRKTALQQINQLKTFRISLNDFSLCYNRKNFESNIA